MESRPIGLLWCICMRRHGWVRCVWPKHCWQVLTGRGVC